MKIFPECKRKLVSFEMHHWPHSTDVNCRLDVTQYISAAWTLEYQLTQRLGQSIYSEIVWATLIITVIIVDRTHEPQNYENRVKDERTKTVNSNISIFYFSFPMAWKTAQTDMGLWIVWVRLFRSWVVSWSGKASVNRTKTSWKMNKTFRMTISKNYWLAAKCTIYSSLRIHAQHTHVVYILTSWNARLLFHFLFSTLTPRCVCRLIVW